jgi:hypothetical protein
MSVTVSGRLSDQLSGRPVRRVREEVKDGLAVIAFSATASTALALTLLLLARLAD